MRTIMVICVLLIILLLQACGTTVGKLNPALTSKIPAPKLKGPTYNDAIVLGVESRAVIKRFNCRTYLQRREQLPTNCK